MGKKKNLTLQHFQQTLAQLSTKHYLNAASLALEEVG
jgi:hypothetical protein